MHKFASIQGRSVRWQKSMKYPGVWLDRCDHVTETLEKAYRVQAALYPATCLSALNLPSVYTFSTIYQHSVVSTSKCKLGNVQDGGTSKQGEPLSHLLAARTHKIQYRSGSSLLGIRLYTRTVLPEAGPRGSRGLSWREQMKARSPNRLGGGTGGFGEDHNISIMLLYEIHYIYGTIQSCLGTEGDGQQNV